MCDTCDGSQFDVESPLAGYPKCGAQIQSGQEVMFKDGDQTGRSQLD